jgi:hypothetical protein
MRKRTFLIFVAYIWTKTLLGLAFHPFLTVKEVTRRPVILPTIFSPFIGLFVLFIFGRIGAILISFYGVSREIIALFLSITLISIVFWQVLLLYLLISVILAYWRR